MIIILFTSSHAILGSERVVVAYALSYCMRAVMVMQPVDAVNLAAAMCFVLPLPLIATLKCSSPFCFWFGLIYFDSISLSFLNP